MYFIEASWFKSAYQYFNINACNTIGGQNLRPCSTESRVHENDLLCHDGLDTRDSQWQKLTYLAPSKTRHVRDADV